MDSMEKVNSSIDQLFFLLTKIGTSSEELSNSLRKFRSLSTALGSLSLGLDWISDVASIPIGTPTRVRARTHKKKRINKKWEKRYGYKIIYI